MSGTPLLPFADINAEFAKDKQLKREEVTKLEEWQRFEPHLPGPLYPIETALFLQSCYYSNEAAKKCIDLYYTLRTHTPEFFSRFDPLSPEMQMIMDTFMMISLPDLTPEGYLVFYFRLLNPNPNVFSYDASIKIYDMVADLEIRRRSCFKGHISIIDLQGATIAHMLKSNVVTIRKSLLFLQNAMPLRLMSFHFVNAVPFMDKILALIRPFLNKKLIDVLHVHFGDNSTIFKYVPKDILPIECGGSQFCATEYFKNVTRKTVECHSHYLKMLEMQLVDESKRPGKLRNTQDIFGVNGTFKNLDID